MLMPLAEKLQSFNDSMVRVACADAMMPFVDFINVTVFTALHLNLCT